MEELMLKIENVKKKYKLGEIGGTTLRDELQRLRAKLHNKPDPTKMIGAKDYNRGETFMALNGVSFEVKKGERVGIIGHNGAGKSTLLKLISRVTAPTEGTISLNGRVASMLEVGTGFHAELTGRENVYMNGAILGMTKKEIDAKVEEIIEFSEVRQFIDTPVKRYSSGMYVKLAFSVAAHLDSEIMIMDEVLAVGDMAFQKKCIDKMNQVSKDEGRTILYVSHNMNTIRDLCDRVVVLDHGTVIFNGDVEEGINIYMGVKDDGAMPIHYDLTNIDRPVKRYGQQIKLISFDFLEKQTPVYCTNEKMKFNLKFIANDDINDLRLFFSIKTASNVAIGSALTSQTFCNTKKGETYSYNFTLDISNIVPDKYYFMLNICIADCKKNIYNYDRPLQNIRFQILENENLGLRWDNVFWGNVNLNNIEKE